MEDIKYKFYPSLLDSLDWAEKTGNEQQLLDQMNRVRPKEKKDLERMGRGTALNEVIDKLLKRNGITVDNDNNYMEWANDFSYRFPKMHCDKIAKSLKGSKVQLWTNYYQDNVLFGGYIDYLKDTSVIDLKLSLSYQKGNFEDKAQALIYPLGLSEEGHDISQFVYFITDGIKTAQYEVYPFDINEAQKKLSIKIKKMVDFVEANRDKITDKKIFAEDMEYQQVDFDTPFPFGKNKDTIVGRFSTKQLIWWTDKFQQDKYPNGFKRGFIDFAKTKIH